MKSVLVASTLDKLLAKASCSNCSHALSNMIKVFVRMECLLVPRTLDKLLAHALIKSVMTSSKHQRSC